MTNEVEPEATTETASDRYKSDEERLSRIEEFVGRRIEEFLGSLPDDAADAIRWLTAQLLNEKMKVDDLAKVVGGWAPTLLAEGRLSINEARAAMQGTPCDLRPDMVHEEMAAELRRLQ